eukprot:CAMPEP_0172655204 /NCGR_PEP_ID=MMETSP1074-20121228/488_1 /TAXON_ID=2916 /ORGANISM="Ceratium fusus, Strain PA161109" /LENGTH=73 /DNA_ID=CAMNT_0013469773 /DNA_START=268 /DNA_END=485 /DNA_ORIENTATION=-
MPFEGISMTFISGWTSVLCGRIAQRSMLSWFGHVPPVGAHTGLAGIVMLYFIFLGGSWSTTASVPGTATAVRT